MKTIELQVMELFKAMQDINYKAFSDIQTKIMGTERQVLDLLKTKGVGISDEAIAEAYKYLNPYPPSL